MSSPILNLPDEVFASISSYFSLKDAVCFEATNHQFKKLVQRHFWDKFKKLDILPYLRQKSGIDVSNVFKFEKIATGLIRRTGRDGLHFLSMSHFGPFEHGLRTGLESVLIEFCTNLHTLELNGRLLDSHWIIKVSQGMPKLKCLSLNRAYFRNYGHLNDALLVKLLLSWCNLEALSLKDNRALRLSCYESLPITLLKLDLALCHIRGSYIRGVLERCQKLTSLHIAYRIDLVLTEQESWAQLRALSLDRYNEQISSVQFHLREQVLYSILASTSNLTSLTLQCNLIGERFFEVISACLPNLRLLALPGTPIFEFDSIDSTLQPLTRLEHLIEIKLVGNLQFAWPFLTKIMKNCHRLLSIDVSFAIANSSRRSIDEWQVVTSLSLQSMTLKGYCKKGNEEARVMKQNLLEIMKKNCSDLKKIVF